MPTSRAPLRVAINLVNFGLYVDRFRMLCRLSTLVERLFVLTDEVEPRFAAEAAEYPRLRLVALGRKRFRPRAHAWLDAQVAGPGLDIVHDTFGHLGDWMQVRARVPNRRERLLTTQYTSNQVWFESVRWRHPFDRAYAALRVISHWRDRRVCRAADCTLVLGPGHDAALARAHKVPADRVRWVPSEIDVRRFRPAPRPAGGPPTVLFTGAVIRNKGIDTLLAAMVRLREARPDVRLVLVGRVPGLEKAWLARAVAASGLGDALTLRSTTLPQSEVITLYRSATVFALPSLFEGSPRSLREAIACGCRAVASDIPGNRGIDPEGAFIRFAPTDDAEAWAQALAETLDEGPAEARARVVRGQSHLRAHHSLDAVAARWVSVYRSELVAVVDEPVDGLGP